MAKRPSAASTRSKQHQVLRYIYSTDLQTTAKDYNVSTKKLQSFVLGNPRRLKGRVLKDPVFQAIYKKDVKLVAKKNKTKLVPRLSRKRYYQLGERKDLPERLVKAREYRTVSKVREYERTKAGKVSYRKLSTRQVQTKRARTRLALIQEKDLSTFTTKEAVRNAFKEGLLDNQDVRTIVSIWAEEYPDMDEEYQAGLMDDLMESSQIVEEVEE